MLFLHEWRRRCVVLCCCLQRHERERMNYCTAIDPASARSNAVYVLCDLVIGFEQQQQQHNTENSYVNKENKTCFSCNDMTWHDQQDGRTSFRDFDPYLHITTHMSTYSFLFILLNLKNAGITCSIDNFLISYLQAI